MLARAIQNHHFQPPNARTISAILGAGHEKYEMNKTHNCIADDSNIKIRLNYAQ